MLSAEAMCSQIFSLSLVSRIERAECVLLTEVVEIRSDILHLFIFDSSCRLQESNLSGWRWTPVWLVVYFGISSYLKFYRFQYCTALLSEKKLLKVILDFST